MSSVKFCEGITSLQIFMLKMHYDIVSLFSLLWRAQLVEIRISTDSHLFIAVKPFTILYFML